MFNPCILVPVFNHEGPLPNTLSQLKRFRLPCILVNDGSDSNCRSVIDSLVTAESWLDVVTHPTNRGKGAAIKTGLQYAETKGFSHALQIDADGQHDPEDVPRFLQAARRNPDAVVTGFAVYDESVPKIRLYGRYLTHFWVWVHCLSKAIKDSMCGFRVYPVSKINNIIKREHTGDRMDFDPEILVRAVWDDIHIINLGTHIHYPQNGVSHFQGVSDNFLITTMHTRLFFGMLMRLPRLLKRNLL